ncbi:MAG: hypothetical protein PVF76_05255 [Syntrophobacterales bacterium]|jgi:uncharacterized membrane protein HdeD (DUF308 family)
MKERIRELSFYLPGATLIILGFVVVLFPMLLVALFSTGLILIGITAISAAHKMRKLRRESQWTMVWEPVDPIMGDSLQRVFLYRRW